MVSQMDLAPLYDDRAFLTDWPGIPAGDADAAAGHGRRRDPAAARGVGPGGPRLDADPKRSRANFAYHARRELRHHPDCLTAPTGQEHPA